MKRRGVLAIIISGVALLGLARGGYLTNSGSYRFRMHVEADTPQGPRSASAVYEVYANKSMLHILPEEASGGLTTRGQAVVLDLPGGPVFVLLKVRSNSDGLGALVTQTFRPEAFGGAEFIVPGVRAIGNHFWGTLKAELPATVAGPHGEAIVNWPMMVRFRDIHDPKSIELVDPAAVGIKRIWVETTRDPVSTGIEKRLGWLGSNFSFYKPDPKTGYFVPVDSLDMAQRSTAQDFSSEFGK